MTGEIGASVVSRVAVERRFEPEFVMDHSLAVPLVQVPIPIQRSVERPTVQVKSVLHLF